MNAAPIEGGVNALESYDIKVIYDIELERSAGRHLLLREWLLPVCAPDFWVAMAAARQTPNRSYRLRLILPRTASC